MNFVQLNSALKFGRPLTDPATLRAILTNNETGDLHSPLDTGDGVLADYLEENDDPRHLIVRRDLETRTAPDEAGGYGPQHEKIHQQMQALHGPEIGHYGDSRSVHHLKDETALNVYRHQGKIARIHWDTMNLGGPVYWAAVSPEEGEHILKSSIEIE